MKFSTDDRIFPKAVKDVDNKLEYKELWNNFNYDFKMLPDGDTLAFIYSIYHLLKLYTWYMPGSTMEYPDISLFEHLKITGAFSHCLAAYFNEINNAYTTSSNNRIIINKDHFPVRLWCGDVNGIQQFIYNISNKSAVKSLKGRSMYVQLLAETVANEMLEVAGASIVNTIYSAGGKFYLLLPNTETINKKIHAYTDQLSQKLWNKYHGSLSINVASLGFVMRKENNGRLVAITDKDRNNAISPGGLWKLMADEVGAQKQQRFKTIIYNNFEALFTPHGAGGNVDICAVTGMEIDDKSKSILQPEDIEQGDIGKEIVYISPEVKEQIDLGKALVGHTYLTLSHKEQKNSFQIGNNTNWKILKGYNNNEQYKEKTWILTNWRKEINLIPDGNIEKTSALGFRLYGGSNVAAKESDGRLVNKSFEELLENDGNQEQGFSKLAILRMDIDNLGELFMKGLTRQERNGKSVNYSSFSALATLSTQLDVFFSGYVNFLRDKPEYKDNINIIYSGGDDLFAVGKWDKTIAFAAEIRNDFRKYVCGREDISISGGITLVRPKFPIAKAADLAGEAEERAKDKKIQNGETTIEKNAISLFGIAINWEKEWPFVKNCKDDLVRWIKEDKISKGILMKIFKWYDQYKQGVPDWQWQSAYSLARAAKSRDNNVEQRYALNQIKDLIYCGQYQSRDDPKPYINIQFETIIAACRWAELELRNLKN